MGQKHLLKMMPTTSPWIMFPLFMVGIVCQAVGARILFFLVNNGQSLYEIGFFYISPPVGIAISNFMCNSKRPDLDCVIGSSNTVRFAGPLGTCSARISSLFTPVLISTKMNSSLQYIKSFHSFANLFVQFFVMLLYLKTCLLLLRLLLHCCRHLEKLTGRPPSINSFPLPPFRDQADTIREINSL